MKQCLTIRFLTFIASLTAVASSRAATVTLTNSNDALSGSLRQAIQDANPNDSITFDIPTSDPADGMTFWHVNEYYMTTSSFNGHTPVGKFDFVGGPTPTPPCGWSAGPDMPSTGARLVGVYFPANGKFYEMGGRASDLAGSEFNHPFEYDPGSNSWTTKSATYPDPDVNDMACGVLADAGTPYIYCVGGSQVTVTGTFDRVFRYDPVVDVISSVAAPWPGGLGMVLPGGFTVFNNKLYILGGFDTIAGNATNQIWELTPATNAWVQKSAVLPVPLGYIPTTTIGSLIYTGGGSDITGGLLTDTTNSFVYNPVADSISTIASIPRATGETRALNFNGQMLVMGGGRTAPNPSNEVDVYDPGTNTWSTSIPAFTTARRNFPTDTDGTSRIWLAGGYDSTGVPVSSMEFSVSIGQLQNISTRLRVLSGDNVSIGGFIIPGPDPKRVIVRGIGPSLGNFGVPDVLADPMLELHDGAGTLIATNDNWKSDQQAEIEGTGLQPTNDLEAAIVTTLPADGAGYTAILRGKNNTTGVGLIEAYDLDGAANSKLANISTRGFVDTADNAMIGGFILGDGTAEVIVRAIGPSLTAFGVAGALQDPTLDLYDSFGTLVVSNDNWKETQQTEIAATGLPPSNDKESAILMTLLPAPYTAIVRGKNDTTGVALVEVYELN